MGQIKPLDYLPTHPSAYSSFAPERITPRNVDTPVSSGARTLQLAVPAGWTVEAACLNEWGPFDSGHRWQQAKAICEGCPVRAVCLADALVEESETDIRFGVRGGLTAVERSRLDSENSGYVA